MKNPFDVTYKELRDRLSNIPEENFIAGMFVKGSTERDGLHENLIVEDPNMCCVMGHAMAEWSGKPRSEMHYRDFSDGCVTVGATSTDTRRQVSGMLRMSSHMEGHSKFLKAVQKRAMPCKDSWIDKMRDEYSPGDMMNFVELNNIAEDDDELGLWEMESPFNGSFDEYRDLSRKQRILLALDKCIAAEQQLANEEEQIIDNQ